MNATLVRIAGLALLAAAAVALLVAPIHARAADVTDRHEIPVFVLDRIEIAAGAQRIT